MVNLHNINEYLEKRINQYKDKVGYSKYEFEVFKDKFPLVLDANFHRLQNLYDGYKLIVYELEKVKLEINQV